MQSRKQSLLSQLVFRVLASEEGIFQDGDDNDRLLFKIEYRFGAQHLYPGSSAVRNTGVNYPAAKEVILPWIGRGRRAV